MVLEGKSNLLQGETGKSEMSGESMCFYTPNKYQGGKAVQALQDQLTNPRIGIKLVMRDQRSLLYPSQSLLTFTIFTHSKLLNKRRH